MPKGTDLALILGGVALAGLTLRTYRGFEAPSGLPSHNQLTHQEAESAVSSAKSYLESNPEDFNAWSRLAIAYYYKGPEFYPDGINALEKARSFGANSESLFYYAGVMYDTLGLPAYAINELSKYSRHHPEDYDTQLRLANLYGQEKKFDEALRLYQSLAQRGGSDPTLWFNFGLVKKEKGDLDGALQCFERAQQIAGRLPEGGFFQQGDVFRLKSSDDQAMALYEKELSVHPDYMPALKALEALQRRKGLYKDARITRNKIASLVQK